MAKSNTPSAYNEDNIVPVPVTGGCLCGALRYEINAQPVVGLHCQCQHCQKVSGTGHGSFLVFPAAWARTNGNASSWSYIADSGGRTARHFCPTCGVAVYSLLELHPDGFVVTASSLDDPIIFSPTVVLFSGEGPEWDCIDEKLKCYSAGL